MVNRSVRRQAGIPHQTHHTSKTLSHHFMPSNHPPPFDQQSLAAVRREPDWIRPQRSLLPLDTRCHPSWIDIMISCIHKEVNFLGSSIGVGYNICYHSMIPFSLSARVIRGVDVPRRHYFPDSLFHFSFTSPSSNSQTARPK